MGDAELAELAGELDAGLGVHDPAGVDQRLRRAEQLDPLEEERPLLREEQGEALVHRHLPRVALHLAEVGVHGGVEREAGEAEPEVEAGVGIDVFALEAAGGDVARAVGGGGDERLRLDGDPALEIVQSADRALLAEEAGVGAADVGPGVGVAGALDHAGDVESPALHVAARVAQALEGDADLDLVALGGDAGPWTPR